MMALFDEGCYRGNFKQRRHAHTTLVVSAPKPCDVDAMQEATLSKSQCKKRPAQANKYHVYTVK
jgi:hypothetical protein